MPGYPPRLPKIARDLSTFAPAVVLLLISLGPAEVRGQSQPGTKKVTVTSQPATTAAAAAKGGEPTSGCGPSVPYINIKAPKPFGIPIQPFGILVGIGIVLGYFLGRRRARLTGLDPDICADGMVWTVVGGFVVAHLVSVIFYFPDKIIKTPWVLLMFWAGLSSFGGFLGGALGAWAFFKRKMKVSFLAYADAIIFGLVPGWVFGRMGCSVVHDHPGLPTNFFLAVQFPGGAKHDLGLYEMLYTIVLTGVLYALKGVRPFYGFHPAVMLLLYAPVRFGLDYLRTADKKYFGYTPGQYFAVAMVLGALALIAYGLSLRKKGIAPRLQPLPSGVEERELQASRPSKAKGRGKSKGR